MTTINSVATDANALFAALASDLAVDLDLPALTVLDNFTLPADPGLPDVTALTIADLTAGAVEGTGVFDVLMKAVNAHLAVQYDKQRITGDKYAQVYLGAIQAVMQFGTQFLLGRDRAHLENLQLLETIKIAQAQAIKAAADIQLVRVQIQQAQYASAEMRLRAYVTRNQYADTKMDLVMGYNEILTGEAQTKLVNEQVDTARAATKNTLSDGSTVTGILAVEKSLKTAQVQTAEEQYEVTRAQIRDTLSTGGAFAGLLGVEKLFKQAQQKLVEEQVDTQRAQTKDTLTAGGPIVGIAAKEKALKDAQSKLVLEQYESQRGQTRGTLSTGEVVVGVLGAQTNLYLQQITSYKRDAESKAMKLMLDTWTARKTIDEGVAVPVQIDTAAIDTAMVVYLSNNELGGA